MIGVLLAAAASGFAHRPDEERAAAPCLNFCGFLYTCFPTILCADRVPFNLLTLTEAVQIYLPGFGPNR